MAGDKRYSLSEVVFFTIALVVVVIAITEVSGSYWSILKNYIEGSAPASLVRTPHNSSSTAQASYVPPAPVWISHRSTFIAGNFVVQPGQYQSWNFTVDPQLRNVYLIGAFHTFGGSGNDIQAVLASPEEFENWINGHEARVFYSTWRTTNGEIRAGPLPPGQYIFAFSNTYSVVSRKEVTADIQTVYQTRAQ